MRKTRPRQPRVAIASSGFGKRRVERFDPADYALMARRARRNEMTETRTSRAHATLQVADG